MQSNFSNTGTPSEGVQKYITFEYAPDFLQYTYFCRNKKTYLL